MIELNEILDSKFDIHRDKETESTINDAVKDKIHTGHTAVMHSDHMKNNGHSVLRLVNKNKEVEYHFLDHKGDFDNHKLDNKSMLHAMKIIHDDSGHYLTKHSNWPIKLQGANLEQAKHYHLLAHKLLKTHNISGRNVVDKGETPRTDGDGTGHTIMIECVKYKTLTEEIHKILRRN